MDFHNHHLPTASPSTSSSSSLNNHSATAATSDPMHSWWESISKARSFIHRLSSLLPPSSTPSLSSLADSDRPAFSLLSSQPTYSLISSSLSSSSGSGDDPLCHWLYDTYLSSDPDLRLIVLSLIPLVVSLYLSKLHSSSSTASLPSLAGFEAVLLALYSSETKSRGGKPVLISIPDLSQPSLYHTPLKNNPLPPNKSYPNPNPTIISSKSPLIGVVSPPLEPQNAIKSTKRASIVGIALDCYYKQISQMPSWSKLDFCKFVSKWAGQNCPCTSEFDQNTSNLIKNASNLIENNGISDKNDSSRVDIDNVVEEMGELGIDDNLGTRILLPWEILQPVLRIVGHCLLGPLNAEEVKREASKTVRYLYARASHDLVPQAILATRSLIQLDRRARETAKVAAEVASNVGSNANTPTKAKKPEILLVSK